MTYLTRTRPTLLVALVLVPFVWLAADRVTAQDDVKAKIAQLEKQLADAKGFDYRLHNELRHYYGAIDEKKSMGHVEIILKHRRFDGYVKQVLGGANADKAKASAALLDVAKKHDYYPNLTATCLAWAGDLEAKPEAALERYKSALAVKGVTPELKESLEDRVLFHPSNRKPWPAKIAAPKGLEKAPGPWSDPDDQTVWPNVHSRSNGDAWLMKNHDKLKQMKPRLLLVNFSNEHSRAHLDRLTRHLIAALAESTKYHGYADKKAAAFLQYEVLSFVDLRDKDRTKGNSRLIPVKDPKAKRGFNMKYRQYFSEELAAHYAIPDPRDGKRFLRLDELLDAGYVHEVWFFESGNVEAVPHVGSFEVVEQKPRYDGKFAPASGQWVQAGNGGDDEQPWVGRSCRIGCVNASRGIGCFLESLAHGMEGTANSGAIPYFTKYFQEYADFNLNGRYNLPFGNLYAVDYGGKPISYPDEKTAVITHRGKEHRVSDYMPVGGSAHFPPNARGHYDLDNDKPVLCTMADWRIGSGKDGKDKAEPYTREKIRNYRDLAPDCMGAWLIYWRQNMPGLSNKQKDDDKRAMKNWWPFLFY